MSVWTTCIDCRGYGHVISSWTGEIDHCRECGGNGLVRNRDERGRYVEQSQTYQPDSTDFRSAS